MKSEAGIQTGGSIPRLTSVEEKLFRDKRYCFLPVGTEDKKDKIFTFAYGQAGSGEPPTPLTVSLTVKYPGGG